MRSAAQPQPSAPPNATALVPGAPTCRAPLAGTTSSPSGWDNKLGWANESLQDKCLGQSQSLASLCQFLDISSAKRVSRHQRVLNQSLPRKSRRNNRSCVTNRAASDISVSVSRWQDNRRCKVRRRRRYCRGLGQKTLDDIAFSGRYFETRANLLDVFSVPPRFNARKVVQYPHGTVGTSDDLKPGCGIIFAASGNEMTAFGTEVREGRIMPSPRRRREQPYDPWSVAAGVGRPTLQEHFMNRGHCEKIAFEGKRTIRERAEAGFGLVAVCVKTVSEHESASEDVKVPYSGFCVADPRPEGGHP